MRAARKPEKLSVWGKENLGTDCFSVEKRSNVMRAVRHSDTAAELRLRAALWRAGLRYRKHLKIIGVRPDICFTRKRVAVFVDGCFWHGCPRHYVAPNQNGQWWHAKLERNRRRDSKVKHLLEQSGWRVLRFWECEVNHNTQELVDCVKKTLEEG